MKIIVIALATALSVSVAVLASVVSFMIGSRSENHSAAVSSAAHSSASTSVTASSSMAAAPGRSAKAAATPEASTKTVYVTPKTQVPARVTLESLGSKPCTTMFGRGVSYERMWEYWEQFGYPASMDVDHDGYPCETVYGNVN